MTDSIYDRIRAGEFKPKLPYPTSPTKSPLLKRTIGDLDEAQFSDALAAFGQHKADKEAYDAARKAYSEESSRCENAFEAALAEYHGMLDHPLRAKVYNKAWQRSHSGGHEEVASAYDDYIDLVKP